MRSLACGALGQSGNAPRFDIADVHVSPKTPTMFMRANPAHLETTPTEN